MGRTVTSVSVIGGDAGTSSRARLALTGDGVPDVGVRQDARRNGGDPPDGRNRQARRDRNALLRRVVAGTDRRAEVLRVGVRLDDRPFRARPGGPRRRQLRVPRHTASAQRRAGEPDRRAPRTAARDVLGPHPRLAVLPPSGDSAVVADRAAAQDVRAPHRRARPTSPVEKGRFIIDNYRAVARLIDTATAHGHARRRAPRKRLLPQRRGGPAGLAGGAARTSRAANWPTP